MVKLTRIYTRGGDAGKTSLGNGARVSKFTTRVEAYGTVDEVNAILGVARLHATDSRIPTTEAGELTELIIGRLQNDLFDLGADLCVPQETGAHTAANEGALRITEGHVTRLEREIDAMNADLDPLSSFILPGGRPAAAHLHHARTVARRAERLMFQLAEEGEQVNDQALHYANRLSDHLFVLARHVNDLGQADILWVPGANRSKE
ncbi:cob(I)yrinic acid a,c-diamide adenosyltransferase [Rhodospirillum sp. A1_3_36]|uniref:cob(I)yrinic acid a,c-diamide adenosyltransferase n=1 Tax=Rhodospirillum sp. A1_3_36 TaxID=3391666 RepID=UPI0039A75A03